MTSDEALDVAKIALTADGGCSDCVGRLMAQLIARFPDHKSVFLETWRGRWQYDLYDGEGNVIE